jgi:hypothetical protein
MMAEQQRRLGRRRAVQALGGVLVTGSAAATGMGAATAQAGSVPSLVGSWLVFVPQPDGSTFVAAQSFTADGGTTTQFSSSNEMLGASLGAGVWQQIAERTFAMSSRAPLYDPRTGAVTGTAMGAGTLTVDTTGDTWSGPGRISFFAADGALQFTTPTSTARATRIVLEPIP